MASGSIEKWAGREPPLNHTPFVSHQPYGYPYIPRSLLALDISHSPSSPGVISSSTGMIRVFGYTPTEGEQDVPITVYIDFASKAYQSVYIRLVVGRKAVATQVRELVPPTLGRWQLEAAAPPFDRQNLSSAKVFLTVQALDDQNSILDSVTFGEFTYWESDFKYPPDSTTQFCDNVKIENVELTSPLTFSPNPLPQSSCISTPLLHSERTAPPRARRKTSLSQRNKPQALMRTRHMEETRHAYTLKAKLQLLNSLQSVCFNWNDSECQLGRRLVRFHREQSGNCLRISFEAITPEEYNNNDIVISCIYREDSHQFYVTSVDIIYLLEKLVDSHFEVDEKNRIRRNLEGLKPITVSKNRAESESFFQRIMDFPDPRPRNIEKDLKVFEWKVLGEALKKIISKYSLYSDVPLPTFTEATKHHGTSANTHSVPPESHTIDVKKEPDEPFSDFVDSSEVNITSGPSSTEVPLLSISPDMLYYPIPPSPMETDDVKNVLESDSSSGSWVSQSTPGNGIGELEDSPVFEIVQTTYPDDTFGSSPFESVNFQTSSGHNFHEDSQGYF